jgi:hypothetical protein
MGRAGVAALLRIDRTILSPEQNNRLDLFLKAVGEPFGGPNASSGIGGIGGAVGPSPAELARDVDFLMDCLDDDDANVRAAAKAALEAVLRHPVDFDPTLTGDARAAAVDKVYEQLDGERRK